MSNLLLYAHFAACLFMTGLIWIIQLLHYPSYEFIDKSKFTDYQKFHTTQITYIVGPVMLIEAISAIWIVQAKGMDEVWLFNFVGLLLIWVATAFYSVPQHNKLQSGYDAKAVRLLVSTNWIRTVLWSLRAGLLTWYLIDMNLSFF